MSNGVNFKDLCIDLRGQLDRVTAERDAALGREHECRTALQVANTLAKQVIAERDALQQRLTAAYEQVDSEAGLRRTVSSNLGKAKDERDALKLRADVLEGLLRRVVESSVLSFEQDAPEELESLEADICAGLSAAQTLSDFPQRQEPGSGPVSRICFHNTGGSYAADLAASGLTEITVTSGFKRSYTEETLKSGGFIDGTPAEGGGDE